MLDDQGNSIFSKDLTFRFTLLVQVSTWDCEFLLYMICQYIISQRRKGFARQDRREGGVAGATAPGPGPRQGPVEREALLYRRMLQ